MKLNLHSLRYIKLILNKSFIFMVRNYVDYVTFEFSRTKKIEDEYI